MAFPAPKHHPKPSDTPPKKVTESHAPQFSQLHQRFEPWHARHAIANLTQPCRYYWYWFHVSILWWFNMLLRNMAIEMKMIYLVKKSKWWCLEIDNLPIQNDDVSRRKRVCHCYGLLTIKLIWQDHLEWTSQVIWRVPQCDMNWYDII